MRPSCYGDFSLNKLCWNNNSYLFIMADLWICTEQINIKEHYLAQLFITCTHIPPVCALENCNFILTQSANLDRFRLIALTLTRISCWRMETGWEKRESIYWVGLCRRNVNWEEWIMFDLCYFILSDLLSFIIFQNNSSINWGRALIYFNPLTGT
jgi:uncharacterized paraquat-inducible protein A